MLPKYKFFDHKCEAKENSFKEVGNILFFSIQQTLIISLNHIHRDHAHQPIDLIIQFKPDRGLKEAVLCKK